MVKEVYNKKTDGDYMDKISKEKEKVEHTQDVDAVAEYHFDKKAKDLFRGECALISDVA